MVEPFLDHLGVYSGLEKRQCRGSRSCRIVIVGSRKPELTAGYPSRVGKRGAAYDYNNLDHRRREREFVDHAEQAYKVMVSTQQSANRFDGAGDYIRCVDHVADLMRVVQQRGGALRASRSLVPIRSDPRRILVRRPVARVILWV